MYNDAIIQLSVFTSFIICMVIMGWINKGERFIEAIVVMLNDDDDDENL